MQNTILEYLVALKNFDYSCSLAYKRPITSKVMTSHRRNKHCQRPKTSWFDFVFPFTFENKHRFKNIFALIMEDIDILWLFWVVSELWRRQGNRKSQRFAILIECKYSMLADGTFLKFFSIISCTSEIMNLISYIFSLFLKDDKLVESTL